MTSPPD